MSGVAALLSAVMNNVAALALLMPVDLQASAKAGRSPAHSLMPISFASILGGMITLIGTPPNIIIAEFRSTAQGEAFTMFDFAPVGLVCSLFGVLFVAIIGWRLLPSERAAHDSGQELIRLADYVAEVQVTDETPLLGRRVRELDDLVEESDVAIVGLVRDGQRVAGMGRRETIKAEDLLVLKATPAAIEQFAGEQRLKFVRPPNDSDEALERDDDLALVEVVVPEGARIENRSVLAVGLLARHGVTLLGVSRQGKPFRERIRKLQVRAGDVLLLLGPEERMPEVVSWLGCLPLAERGLRVVKRNKALLAAGIFGTAIVLASIGAISLTIALAVAVVALVVTQIVPLRELYDSIEWPVIVLLGAMIPIGAALESTGSSELIVSAVLSMADNVSPAVILTLLLVITMTLSDVMNNTATAVIAAPIAFELASRLGVSADPFLMAVAVGASCAFLTPIGHKNNTLIMGPGGYRFSDYWRMGLPLEVLIVVVAVPTILTVWPL
jgi:di/tricarboxylate transporter